VSRKPKAASSGFNAEVYFVAAQEHITVAVELHDTGRYVLAHYIAGVAVECLLRAYRFRVDPQFDERHDLYELFRAAQFDRIISEERRPEIVASLTEVARRWNNDFRFRSEASVRSYLKASRLDRGIRGNFLKESSRIIVRAALQIVDLGVSQWDRSSSD
jgi:HEPN domain-containing protein